MVASQPFTRRPVQSVVWRGTTSDYVLAAIREAVYRRSLPLATRTLRIEPSSLGRAGELVGAVHLALDELFEPARLARWLPHGSPSGRPELATGDEAASAA